MNQEISPRETNLPLAIMYAVVAAFIYALLGVVIKLAEHMAPTEMAVFFRQLISLFLLMPFIGFGKGSFNSLKTKFFPLHFLRSFASLASMYCLFFTLKYLPLVDALMITYTRPLFIPLIVLVWFRKPWSKTTWLGLILGFLGVSCIMKPDASVFNIATFIGLGSAFFGALAFTSIRRLTKSESSTTIMFYYFALSLPIAGIPCLVRWQSLPLLTWGYLAIIGVLGVLYQTTLTHAYRHAKASIIASMLYSTVVFGALFDWWLGDLSIDAFAIVGIILIFIGTLITIKQKHTPYPPEKKGTA